MIPSTIDTSIIICTRNRAKILTSCLDSIWVSAQRCVAATNEVIVVDNGSSDDTRQVAESWFSAHDQCHGHVITENRVGLSNARNAGLSASHGHLIIFIDDDCLMDPDYIQRAIALDRCDTEPMLRGGAVHLGTNLDLPLTIKTSPTTANWSIKERSARHYNLGNAILGCNMVFRRSIYEQLGPFDVNLGVGSKIPSAEDTDYIFRAYVSAILLEYNPSLIVKHYHGRRLPVDARKLIINYTIGFGALYAKYMLKEPDLCRQLWWDLKKIPAEIIQRRNLFEPQYDLNFRQKVAYALRGTYRYIFRQRR